ncbi:hypothetical protein AB4876_02710 [Zhongshania guokunii]|uniref:Uncharacterized protein n=1 Tax=Zhongshania guokunii TaxID=641783 RepID=A0ABV3U1V9_9GAMM
MFSDYFEAWEVKSEYSKEYVSLWKGWLGQENLHKLDEVTESEWCRFNVLLRSLASDFALEVANCEKQSLTKISDIETVLSSYNQSMDKEPSAFTKFIIPELECVISEEWDYTYIIWHKNNGAVEALSPYIKAASLEHFND